MEQPPTETPTNQIANLDAVVLGLARKRDADIYVFSAGIFDLQARQFIQIVKSVSSKRKNAILALTTRGGSADAAFQIARCLKHRYTSLILYIFGQCKSAGTLVAIAADEIVISELGHFGPLDVQLADKTELFGQTPALDIQQALVSLSESSFDFFIKHFIEMGRRGLPTATATDTAKALVMGVIEPIASQIDPLLLGRVDRSLKIAKEYSVRLNPKFLHIEKIVSGYPSHEFVIDFGEAKDLFPNVREPDTDENALEEILDFIGVIPAQANNIFRLSKSEAEVVQSPEPENEPRPDDSHPEPSDNPLPTSNGRKHGQARRPGG